MKKIVILSISSLICFILAGYNYGIFPNQQPSQKQSPKTAEQTEVQTENVTAESENAESPLTNEFTLLKSEVKKLTEAQARQSSQMKGITPVKVNIPSINVEANIEQVGILENGQMGVPQEINNVGWFEPGVKPGSRGSAVLAGHVDSKTGPAIFFNLKDLKQGDEIIVTDEKGTSLTFIVKNQESYPRGSAPIDEIFQTEEGQNLNLITCSGTFNRSAGTHEERLVVFAELKKDKETKKEAPPASPESVEINGTFVTWHAVRSENIVGYRIYRGDKNGGNFEKAGSVSAHERKSFTDENAADHTYYVTAIDAYGQESEPSKIAAVK
ncbi:class F sortase [Metabacillus idriensis]|uniref:class F sortase n=1 Tax=Metabacillus idriensis TaxID=324768 RepID=UPI002813584E|nr:class F sortase [Metabacillus idriensis]MDR0136595.1 class F sortase [Metabacillus idriensis]